MKSKMGIYFLLVIIVLMLAVFTISASYQYLTAKLLPMTLSGSILVLAVVAVVRDIRGKKTALAETDAVHAKRAEGFSRRYLVEAGWIVGFALAIFLLGFMIAIPLFIISYLKAHGRRWLTAIVMAAVMTVVSYGIFGYFLEIRLYPGLILQLLGF